MTTESLSVTIEGELLTVEIGTVAAPAGGGGGGSGDVVGPASATDGRIAEFDGTTGKLIKQGTVTATAVASHLGSTSNPHSVTAAQVGADPTGTAAAAVSAHAGAVDPHGDRAYADGLAGNYATAGHNHSGVYQPLATVLTNTTAAFTTAQETKLSGIEAAADVTDAGNVGAAIDGATAKTTPVDADTVPLIDSAAGNVLKKLSWANIKATLKTYFDTLYQAASATLTTWAGITPGTGIATALGTNVGTAGSMVVNGGALGTPSSGNLANCTGYPGAGDVVGPASSTDNAVARFDSTTGKLLQNTSNVTVADTGAVSITPDANAKALTVASHTHTTSNPAVDIAQTWNAGAVEFTAVKVNVTNTASAAASLLQDWQVGGVSKFRVDKAGTPTITSGIITSAEVGGRLLFNSQNIAGRNSHYMDYQGIFTVVSGGYFGWSTSGTGAVAAYDLALHRDAANTLAQRNTTSAQTLRIYGTYTDASNYVRLALAATSTGVTLSAETAGTGANDVSLTLSGAGVAHIIASNPFRLPSFTVASLPSAATAAAMIYVSNESGGATVAFSDGTNWRRMADRAIVS